MLPVTVYIVGAIAVLLTIWWWRSKQWRKELPPGPPCYPIIGNIGMIDTRDTVAEFERLWREYGDVVCFLVGSSPVVIVNGSEALRELFVKEADSLSIRPAAFWLTQLANWKEALRELFVKEADSLSIRPAAFWLTQLANWKGIVASNGHLWKEQRSFALKTLRNFGFGKRSLESRIQQEVEGFLQCLDNSKGQPLDFVLPLKVCVANVICSISMNRTYEFDDKRLISLMDSIDRIFSDPAIRGPAAFVPFGRYIPGDPLHFKIREKVVENLIGFLGETVDEHMRTLDEDNVRDYIDAFLIAKQKAENDPGSTFSNEQLLQTLRDFFVAGHETTVTALRWAFLLMIHNPEVQRKMKVEIESVVGNAKMPSWDQKTQLPYCEAVIEECLRNKNIAPTTLPHGVETDVYWKGYRIPKGSLVFANLHSVSYDPNLFPNPTKFDPNRFLDENGQLNNQHMTLPFGIGRRICLGEALARMEIFLFLAAVIQRYELLPEDTNNLPSLDGKLGTTYSPLPYKMRAILRE